MRSRWIMLRGEFPALPKRRIVWSVEFLVWVALILPIAYGIVCGSSTRADSIGSSSITGLAGFVAETPAGIIIRLHMGENVITGAQGHVVVMVERDGARVIRADCPVGRCRLMGNISEGSGRVIVCMPNRIVIRSHARSRIHAWTG